MLMHSPRNRIIVFGVVGLAALAAALIFLPNLGKQECPITPATETDFKEAAAIGEDVFEPESWEFEILEHPALISVGWFNYDNKAFGHAQYLMYNCGYTRNELDDFYGEENMAFMLGGYDSYRLTAACQYGDITLRQYDLVLGDLDYISRFWYQPLNATRARDMRLDFVSTDRDQMDIYAARLYPDIPSCAAVED
jgi:hypothetical protein